MFRYLWPFVSYPVLYDGICIILVFRLEGGLACDYFVNKATHRPNVATEIRWLPIHHFWRGISQGHLFQNSVSAFDKHLTDAQIRDFHPTIFHD